MRDSKKEVVEEEVEQGVDEESEDEIEYIPKRKCLIKPKIPKSGKSRPMFKTGKKIVDLKKKVEMASKRKKQKKAVVVYLDSSDDDEDDDEEDYDSGASDAKYHHEVRERVVRQVEKEFNAVDYFC